jgi:hypothetical protein
VAGNSGLLVIDVTLPHLPAIAARHPVRGGTRDVAMSGHLAYTVAGSHGFWIVDLSDPAHPARLSDIDIPDTATEVAGDRERAIAGTTEGHLFVIDVTDPADPFVVGQIRMGSEVRDVALADRFAYVVGETGLAVVDVSVTPPILLGSLQASGSYHSVAARGGELLVGLDGGVQRIDVSDPTRPRVTATGALDGMPYVVAFHGSISWVGTETSTRSGRRHRTPTKVGRLVAMGSQPTPHPSFVTPSTLSSSTTPRTLALRQVDEQLSRAGKIRVSLIDSGAPVVVDAASLGADSLYALAPDRRGRSTVWGWPITSVGRVEIQRNAAERGFAIGAVTGFVLGTAFTVAAIESLAESFDSKPQGGDYAYGLLGGAIGAAGFGIIGAIIGASQTRWHTVYRRDPALQAGPWLGGDAPGLQITARF